MGYRMVTVEVRIMKFSPYGSPIPLVFRQQVSSRNSKGFPQSRGVKWGRGRQNGRRTPTSTPNSSIVRYSVYWTHMRRCWLVDVVVVSTTFVISPTTPDRPSRSDVDLNAGIVALALSAIDVLTSRRAARLATVSRDRELTISERNSTPYPVMRSPPGAWLGVCCTWTTRQYTTTQIARS